MLRVLKYIFEIIGWLQIVASPLLLGMGIAAFIYIPNPTTENTIAAVSIAACGLFIGIHWANRTWKNKGTVQFLSRINATPELDDSSATKTKEQP